jgi:hypothetical protein
MQARDLAAWKGPGLVVRDASLRDAPHHEELEDRFHETAQFSFPGLSGKMLEFREPNMIRILEALV